IVIFPLKNAVGISARSTGDLNVQVIMEHFGGGGHQNVAAAQIEGGDIEQIEKEVVDFTKGILNGTKE
ncbi:MAG: hypothetical protein J6I62_09790, partial [Selenomonadaceae bacterium]|nr:hypothetical protein [Selenomonadaceae bacterium]